MELNIRVVPEPVIVEVEGGVADVTVGKALIVDWDEISVDSRYAQDIVGDLENIKHERARHIRGRIYEIWCTCDDDGADEYGGPDCCPIHEIEELP